MWSMCILIEVRAIYLFMPNIFHKFVAATTSFPSEAAGECGYSAKAKASDAGFPVCKHEGAKNESFVNAE